MSMHSYYDLNADLVDWDGIDSAAKYIGQGLQKWGRVDVHQYKEKFGEVRVYCILGFYMFHQLIWPGYVYNQYPWKWMWTADVYLPRWFKWCVNRFAVPYHQWLYYHFYKRAVARWPHLHDEILACADYPKLLEGL